jgi:hypothetical protein
LFPVMIRQCCRDSKSCGGCPTWCDWSAKEPTCQASG